LFLTVLLTSITIMKTGKVTDAYNPSTQTEVGGWNTSRHPEFLASLCYILGFYLRINSNEKTVDINDVFT